MPGSNENGLKDTNQQIPGKTSNPGRNLSYYTVSSTGFASFDRVFSSGELLDRDRSKKLYSYWYYLRELGALAHQARRDDGAADVLVVRLIAE